MAKLTFSKKEHTSNIHLKSKKSWKILIADDEQDVHTLTKTVLKDFIYDNQPVEFLSSYNTKETLDILEKNPDIALILLDVVMDSDDAGLNIVKKIRDEFKNHIIQIVLRTGQPGSAPETDVVISYGINDYKEKTELTSKKLITTIITSLRTYKTLKTLKSTKKGLQAIIKSSEDTNDILTSKLFIKGVLTQILSILKLNHDSILIEHIDGISVEKEKNKYSIIASTGKFNNILDIEQLDTPIKDEILQALTNKQNCFYNNSFIGYLEIDDTSANVIYISNYEGLSYLDQNLIEMFFKHSSTKLNNLKLNEEIFTTQKVLIETLGEVVEKRYVDDPYHIKRVAKMSYLLAIKSGLNEKEARSLETVSPMHDVGKIGISDQILLKPGKLTVEEFKVIKTHAKIGYNILKKAEKKTLDKASIVALEHHERWDGKGYPQGLKKDEISIDGRIVAVVDVFDALYNKRCYKEPWEPEDIKAYFKEERGKQFDPELANIFLENIDEFLQIQKDFQSNL